MRQSKTKILPVIVNASNFEVFHEKEESSSAKELNLLKLKRSILKNLISELFEAVKRSVLSDHMITKYVSRNKRNYLDKIRKFLELGKTKETTEDRDIDPLLWRQLYDLNERARAKEVSIETDLQDLLR